MAITFANMVIRIQNILDDTGAATWSTVELAEMLNDGIRDYSNHFPRIDTETISVTAGIQEYDLNSDFMGILSVEYPDGEDPRQFLSRRPYTHPEFWSEDGYYDLLLNNDDDSNNNQIVFGGDLTTGEDANIEYHAEHDLITNTASISGNCSVRPHHQHLLVKYVLWQTTLFLKSAEEKAPTSNSSLLMAQLAQNARRLALDYSTALQQAIYAAEGVSQPVNWIPAGSDSGMERIY